MYSALSGPTDWILRYIKTTFTFLPAGGSNGSTCGSVQGCLIVSNLCCSSALFSAFIYLSGYGSSPHPSFTRCRRMLRSFAMILHCLDQVTSLLCHAYMTDLLVATELTIRPCDAVYRCQ